MELKTEYGEMLEQLLCPAFLVKDNSIIAANQSAIDRQVTVGQDVTSLIAVGHQEYEVFSAGRLCLSLNINEVAHYASVVALDAMHLFYLESEYEASEIRAFALAAQCLREPLSHALNSVEDISEMAAQSPDLNEKILKINRDLYRIHRAICNMSDVGQHGAQRSRFSESRDVSAIVNEIMHKAMHLVANTGRTLEYRTAKKSVYAYINYEKIERAILNMISNALKYSPESSAITAELRIAKEKVYFSVQNQIADTANTNNANIFTRFLREPNITSGNAGIGLGITIIRNTALAHGGTLLFEQPADNTVRFTMSLSCTMPSGNIVRSPVVFPVDYAGGYDHMLIELSEVLPSDCFE